MPEFTKDELSLIVQVVNQVTWKPGQSVGLIMAESVINKCNEGIGIKPIKEKGE